MKPNGPTGRITIIMTVLVAFLLGVVLSTGACSRKEQPAEKTVQAESKGEEKKDARADGVVELSPVAVKTAGVEVAPVAETTSSEVNGATAVIELNGDRVSRVSPRVAGRCVSVKGSLGDRVRAGQTLAQIDSLEMGLAWSEYVKSKAQLDLATRSVKREETLFEKKVSPEKDLLKARQELSQAEADMQLAREKIRLLGVDASQVDSSGSGSTHNHGLIPVPAPISGVIIEKTVAQGEMIGPEKTLFTIADLSTLWLMVDIYERDIGRMKTGMQVKLTTSAYPGKDFKGRISHVGDVIDEKSRTMKARVMIDNSSGLLKPGMFASVSIESAKDPKAKKMISLPEEAVYLDGSNKYVFLSQGDGKFVAKEVLTGTASNGNIEIAEGLKPGDRVAIKGVFALKSELKKGTLEAE